MDGHYYNDPIENYEPDENTLYFTQKDHFSEQTGSYYMNHGHGNIDLDDLDVEFGNYMRILTFIFTIFLPRTVFTITYQSFGTFAELYLSEPSCSYGAIGCEHQATS